MRDYDKKFDVLKVKLSKKAEYLWVRWVFQFKLIYISEKLFVIISLKFHFKITFVHKSKVNYK